MDRDVVEVRRESSYNYHLHRGKKIFRKKIDLPDRSVVVYEFEGAVLTERTYSFGEAIQRIDDLAEQSDDVVRNPNGGRSEP